MFHTILFSVISNLIFMASDLLTPKLPTSNTTFSEVDPIITLGSLTTFTFFKSKSDFYYNLNISVHGQSYNAVLLQQTVLNRLPFVVDAYAITEASSSVFYVLNCFYSNRYTNFFFNISNSGLTSVSPIFKGAVWVERELKEFSSIFVRSLLDSRRLLTDYTVLKTKNTPLYYDLVTQEVF